MARTALIAIALIGAGCSAAARLGVSTGSAAPAGAPTAAVAPSAPGGGPGAAKAAASAAGEDRPAVPDLTGKTLDEARAIARGAGFTSEVEASEQPSCAGSAPGVEGHILCQDPEPGQRTNRYAMIQVVIYKPYRPSGMILVPELAALRGLTVDEARQQLRALGHDGPVRIHMSDDFAKGCARDRVCDVGPGGARNLHDEVILFIRHPLDITAPAP